MHDAERPLECSRKIRGIQEWTTPDRRIGDTLLLQIPNEIHMKIISYLGYSPSTIPEEMVLIRKDLSSLSAVCRFYRFFTLPMVYGSISVARAGLHAPLPDFTPFLYSLYLGRDPVTLHLGQYVHYCRINIDMTSSVVDSLTRQSKYPPDLQTFSLASKSQSPLLFRDILPDALEKMYNITTVDLHAVEVTLDLLTSLSVLLKLTSLSIQLGHFCSSVTKEAIATFASRVRLRTLTFFLTEYKPLPIDLHLSDFVPLAASPHLASLCTSWDLLQLLALEKNLAPPPLRKATCIRLSTIHDFQALYQFLLRIPTLTSLSLPTVFNHNTDIQNTSFSLSPFLNLKELYCPLDYAFLFTGPHNLEIIQFHVYMRQYTDHLIFSTEAGLLLSSPNTSLRELEFTDNFLVRTPKLESQKNREIWRSNMRHWVPNLQRMDLGFTVSCDPKEDDFKEFINLCEAFLDTWGPQDTLDHLVIGFLNVDMYNDVTFGSEDFDTIIRPVLEGFRQCYPNLTFFRFCEVVVVNGRWGRH